MRPAKSECQKAPKSAAVEQRRGVRLRGYVPDLQRQLAGCDLAIVQGGLTTCMELTACRRPLIYVPLRDHFEQNFDVRHRLDRYRAGRCKTYDQVSEPAQLADAIVNELSRNVAYLPDLAQIPSRPPTPSGVALFAGMHLKINGPSGARSGDHTQPLFACRHLTPVAMTTAWETTRAHLPCLSPPTRALQ
jgi:Glycosyltransferase family 28 C-terminal domain